jgi:hypothetical protein
MTKTVLVATSQDLDRLGQARVAATRRWRWRSPAPLWQGNAQQNMAAGLSRVGGRLLRELDRTLPRLEARGPNGSSVTYRLFNQHDSRQEPLEVGWRPEDTGWA